MGRSPFAITAPAAERNKEPILGVLRRVLPASGLVVEIASGTGQHVVHFARALPNLTWQPSDPDPQARASVEAWIAETGLPNIREPVALDVEEEVWPIEDADGVLCINMVHIAPWSATEGLMKGAARLLNGAGVLVMYGPYRRFGRHITPSNEAFDADLRARNAAWGVRDLEAVAEVAQSYGLQLEEVVGCPPITFVPSTARRAPPWSAAGVGLDARPAALAASGVPPARARARFLRNVSAPLTVRPVNREAPAGTRGLGVIHELRIYHCIPGRLPALLKRFGTITLDLWKRHGIPGRILDRGDRTLEQ